MWHVDGYSNTDSYVDIGRKLSAVNYSFPHIRSSRMEPDFENGFQMCTRHIIMIAVSFFPIRKDAQVPRTSDWPESWLMRLVEEEEEGFVMAIKELKSNTSAAALHAVTHFNKERIVTSRINNRVPVKKV